MTDYRKIEAARITEAEAEAKRFLRRVKEYRDAIKEPGTHPRQNAAVKRASMDLSRALADVRRSLYA